MIKQKKNQSKKLIDDVFEKMPDMPEFVTLFYKLDSLKKAGINADVSFSFLEKSFYPKDSLKNIALIYVEDNISVAHNIEYIIKYDRDLKELIAVEKN